MSEFEITPQTLPASWAVTTLGAVVDYGKTQKAEPSEIPGDAWVLELEDIEKDSSRILARVTQSQRQSRSTKNRFNAGDVLYGKLRPYLNKVVIADKPGFCTTEIVPLQATPALDNRYLFHWLKHPAFLKYVEAASHGMNMPRLGTEAGRSAPLVLASRQEQTRIADKLDTLLARIQACNDRLDAIPALLKRFRQAVWDAASCGSLTEGWRAEGCKPKAWQKYALNEIILEMRNGLSAKPNEQPPGKRILRISSVRSGMLDLQDFRYLVATEQEAKVYELRQGDLLFTRYNGTIDFVGVCAVVPEDIPNYVYPDKLIRVRVRMELVLSDFLVIAFGARTVRHQIENLVKSSAGQKGISGSDLKAIKLSLPELDEQAEIVSQVKALFQLAADIEARHAVAIRQAQRLTPLTLAKAFRGELVQQDVNDEPANVLLQRIANIPAKAVKTQRGRPWLQQPNEFTTQPATQPNEAALPSGAWATSGQPDEYATTAQLIAVLKAWGQPMPQDQARLAAVLCLQPRLFTAAMPAPDAAPWRRLVGAEAEPLPASVAALQPAVHTHWRRALAGLRARGDLLESGAGPQDTWALGPGADRVDTTGWPDGRAGWVVAYLRAHGIEALLPSLSAAAVDFVHARAA